MSNQLNKIIGLIQKTGDKCVVFNQTNEAYVVMTLKDYEKLVLGKSEVHNLTEDELLDKINRDIAVWRSLRDLEDKEIEWDEVLAEQFGRSKPEAWDKESWDEDNDEEEETWENPFKSFHEKEPWEKDYWEEDDDKELALKKEPWEEGLKFPKEPLESEDSEPEKQPWEKPEDHYYFEPIEQ